jgi:catechol 2,3-dioxygenase-like lactoylglutathione lyase family enzyme|tara:strand:+ start:5320 stop:5676 length:357 start_codon:yes stop_codon:yes gene_type:complete
MNDIGNLFIALKVKDAPTSAEFYTKLGFTPIEKDRWNQGYACLEYQGTRIALMTFIPQTVLLNLEQPNQAAVEAFKDRLSSNGLSYIAAGAEGKGLFLDDPHDGGGVYIFTEEGGSST